MLEPSAAADQAAGQIVRHAGLQNDWADQFSNMRLDNGSQPSGWAEEFAKVRTYLIARVHSRCKQLRGYFRFSCDGDIGIGLML